MPNSLRLAFALNHMAAPMLPLREFFALARSLNVADVEIRNDIAKNAILDGTPADEVRRLAAEAEVRILTINALQRFNDWTPVRQSEAVALADFAAACGAVALVLVPVNDGSGGADRERPANLRAALKALRPILADRGILGYVEPLGFDTCSLRSKREAAEAAEAVEDTDGFRVLKIVHDTFHHCLADEPDIFPGKTGLVHISAVKDRTLPLSEMRDAHRVLVGPADRLKNIEQIAELIAGGYDGPFSFEPFAAEVHALPGIRGALAESMDFVRARALNEVA